MEKIFKNTLLSRRPESFADRRLHRLEATN
jgi:hypothetical protein